MKIIEAAKEVLKANESLETGALQEAIRRLQSAIEAHDFKINLNRAKKLLKKSEQQ